MKERGEFRRSKAHADDTVLPCHLRSQPHAINQLACWQQLQSHFRFQGMEIPKLFPFCAFISRQSRHSTWFAWINSFVHGSRQVYINTYTHTIYRYNNLFAFVTFCRRIHLTFDCFRFVYIHTYISIYVNLLLISFGPLLPMFLMFLVFCEISYFG